MNIKYAAILISAAFCALPAQAQYHYSYGDSRVVNQNQTGLYTPSSSYIGAGTLSRSAQGKCAGVGAELPSVNLGSHVRTAGDGLYNGNVVDRQENGSIIYRDDKIRMNNAKWQQYYRRKRAMEQNQMQRQQQGQQEQRGYYYVPGSNGAAAGYGSAPSQTYRGAGGAATYDDPNRQAGGSRNF